MRPRRVALNENEIQMTNETKNNQPDKCVRTIHIRAIAFRHTCYNKYKFMDSLILSGTDPVNGVRIMSILNLILEK